MTLESISLKYENQKLFLQKKKLLAFFKKGLNKSEISYHWQDSFKGLV